MSSKMVNRTDGKPLLTSWDGKWILPNGEDL